MAHSLLRRKARSPEELDRLDSDSAAILMNYWFIHCSEGKPEAKELELIMSVPSACSRDWSSQAEAENHVHFISM